MAKNFAVYKDKIKKIVILKSKKKHTKTKGLS